MIVDGKLGVDADESRGVSAVLVAGDNTVHVSTTLGRIRAVRFTEDVRGVSLKSLVSGKDNLLDEDQTRTLPIALDGLPNGRLGCPARIYPEYGVTVVLRAERACAVRVRVEPAGEERTRSLRRRDTAEERRAASEVQDAAIHYAAVVDSTDTGAANTAYARLLRASLDYAAAVLNSFGGGG